MLTSAIISVSDHTMDHLLLVLAPVGGQARAISGGAITKKDKCSSSWRIACVVGYAQIFLPTRRSLRTPPMSARRGKARLKNQRMSLNNSVKDEL